jgi:hypothetical protein
MAGICRENNLLIDFCCVQSTTRILHASERSFWTPQSRRNASCQGVIYDEHAAMPASVHSPLPPFFLQLLNLLNQERTLSLTPRVRLLTYQPLLDCEQP